MTDQTTGATSDLLPGHVTTPTPASKRPAPADPGAAGNADAFLASISPDRLTAMRARAVETFDKNARSAKFQGGDLTPYSAEVRAKLLAGFDSAARADGLSPAEPPDPALVNVHRNHGVPLDPRPGAYSVVFPREFAESLPVERLAVVKDELTAFAAAMKFSAPLGTAVLDRLVETVPRMQTMTPEAREAWQRDQERLAGGDEALTELRERAAAVLKTANPAKGTIGDVLASTPAFSDVWLLRSLINHGQAVAVLAARGGKTP